MVTLPFEEDCREYSDCELLPWY